MSVFMQYLLLILFPFIGLFRYFNFCFRCHFHCLTQIVSAIRISENYFCMSTIEGISSEEVCQVCLLVCLFICVFVCLCVLTTLYIAQKQLSSE